MQANPDIFGVWPSLKVMADDLGEKYDTVLKWQQRKRIPEHAWESVIECAAQKNVTITVSDLHASNAPPKQRGYPAHKKNRKKRRTVA